MKVRILRATVLGADKVGYPGDVVELEVAIARGFIYQGKAERFDEAAKVDEEAEVMAETATAEPPETAMMPAAAHKKADRGS